MHQSAIQLSTDPSWLVWALAELGVKETPGPKATPRVLHYLSTVKLPPNYASSDETAWCSAFVNAALASANLSRTHSAMARSWERYGAALPMPHLGGVLRRGGIAVFPRGDDPKFGHVTFPLDYDPRTGVMQALGGNQGDAVSIKPYKSSNMIAYRWPSEVPVPV